MSRLKWCSGCQEDHGIDAFSKGQNYCKAFAKKWRKAHRDRLRILNRGYARAKPRYYAEYQRAYQKRRKGTRKVMARMKANLAFDGDTRVSRCADCGTGKHVDKAHISYYKPLVVVPLCRVHHRLFDRDRSYRRTMKVHAVTACVAR